MLLFKIVKQIINNKKIDIYNFGNHERDFTYIEDISKSICACVKSRKKMFKKTNFKILNLGRGKPIKLMQFIEIVENKLKKQALKNFLPKQKGDVLKTYSNIKELKKATNFVPKTNHKVGISKFIDWYKSYYNVKV